MGINFSDDETVRYLYTRLQGKSISLETIRALILEASDRELLKQIDARYTLGERYITDGAEDPGILFGFGTWQLDSSSHTLSPDGETLYVWTRTGQAPSPEEPAEELLKRVEARYSPGTIYVTEKTENPRELFGFGVWELDEGSHIIMPDGDEVYVWKRLGTEYTPWNLEVDDNGNLYATAATGVTPNLSFALDGSGNLYAIYPDGETVPKFELDEDGNLYLLEE